MYEADDTQRHNNLTNMDHHHHHHHHNHNHQHHHGVGGGQGHAAHESLTEWNKNHFHNVAESIWELPAVKILGEQVTYELQTKFEWFGVRKSEEGAETKMLDYACGNGIVSKSLASLVPIIRGMDIAPGMVDQYNKFARQEKYSEARMHAVAGNLLDDDESASLPEDYAGFDLIVISLALHHVSDPEAMIAKFAARLAPGGVVVVLDWISSSGIVPSEIPADDPVRHTVSRHGFEEDELRAAYEKAGLRDWGWRLFEERTKLPLEFGGEKQLFLARGSKPLN